MNDNLTLSADPGVTRLTASNKMGFLKGLLAVFVPLVIVAEFAGTLGSDTSFATGLVINLAYLLAIAIATVVLKNQESGWRDLGLARPGSWRKTIVIALGALVVMIAALLATQALLANLPGQALPPSDQSDYNPLAGNLPLFLIMFIGSFTLVAFGEEMVFRAFLIHSLAGFSGKLKGRWAFALVGSSLLFALGHYDWGLAGVIEMFVAGLIFGTVYLRTGRNLWAPIILHGLIDALKFSLIFAGLA